MLRQGTYLQGRYEILEQIGSGGMSDVYKAKCHTLNRMVAIKVLKKEFSHDSGFVNKFRMEAQAAAGLSHPNIVNVYDVVHEVIDELDIHYIIMELIEGITLKSYIAKKGRLGIKETIGISIQVAQGMAAAHEQKIIHRDIKPQNMIISRDGKVKVADFGIARAVSAQTSSSTAIGSVHYISPEQAKGKYSDARSDIYSFGITMYEMVTGKVPFEGDNTVAIAMAHLEMPVTPPSQLNPNIPISLEKIILKCTQKEPGQRYNSATEVISDLRKALINPEVDFVKTVPIPDPNAHTLIISEEELGQIKEAGRNSGNSRNEVNSDRQNPKKKGKKQSEDNINPQLEKLLTAAGIIAAILIVAVLLFVFSKIGGLFSLGTPKENNTVESTLNSSEETLSDKQTQVPDDLLGLPLDVATEKVKEDTLVIKVVDYKYSDDYGDGEIMALAEENPAGSVVDKYSKIGVYISKGSNSVDMAALNLAGMDFLEAQKLLIAQNIVVNVSEEESTEIEKGKIVRYTPEKVKKGESVNLVVSTGAPVKMVAVPNLLVAQNAEAAEALIVAAGLTKGTVTSAFDNVVPEGQVISQEIAADTQIAEGSPVNYTVSTGKEKSAFKYVASIAEDYEIKNVFGPGSGTSSLQVSIRLRQHVEGKDVYSSLMEPQLVSGDQVLPVRFSGIEGADGVTEGFVEVINASDNTVLKTYPITFVALPRS